MKKLYFTSSTIFMTSDFEYGIFGLFKTETDVFDENGKTILHESVYKNNMSDELIEELFKLNSSCVIIPYYFCKEVIKGKPKKNISSITDEIDYTDISACTHEVWRDGKKIVYNTPSYRETEEYTTYKQAKSAIRSKALERYKDNSDISQRINTTINFYDGSFYNLSEINKKKNLLGR